LYLSPLGITDRECYEIGVVLDAIGTNAIQFCGLNGDYAIARAKVIKNIGGPYPS
jgi:hypothetical protein